MKVIRVTIFIVHLVYTRYWATQLKYIWSPQWFWKEGILIIIYIPTLWTGKLRLNKLITVTKMVLLGFKCSSTLWPWHWIQKEKEKSMKARTLREWKKIETCHSNLLIFLQNRTQFEVECFYDKDEVQLWEQRQCGIKENDLIEELGFSNIEKLASSYK